MIDPPRFLALNARECVAETIVRLSILGVDRNGAFKLAVQSAECPHEHDVGIKTGRVEPNRLSQQFNGPFAPLRCPPAPKVRALQALSRASAWPGYCAIA